MNNHEIYTAFKRMLEAIMTIVAKIQDQRYGVKPHMPILDFVKRFNIDATKIDLE